MKEQYGMHAALLVLACLACAAGGRWRHLSQQRIQVFDVDSTAEVAAVLSYQINQPGMPSYKMELRKIRDGELLGSLPLPWNGNLVMSGDGRRLATLSNGELTIREVAAGLPALDSWTVNPRANNLSFASDESLIYCVVTGEAGPERTRSLEVYRAPHQLLAVYPLGQTESPGDRLVTSNLADRAYIYFYDLSSPTTLAGSSRMCVDGQSTWYPIDLRDGSLGPAIVGAETMLDGGFQVIQRGRSHLLFQTAEGTLVHAFASERPEVANNEYAIAYDFSNGFSGIFDLRQERWIQTEERLIWGARLRGNLVIAGTPHDDRIIVGEIGDNGAFTYRTLIDLRPQRLLWGVAAISGTVLFFLGWHLFCLVLGPPRVFPWLDQLLLLAAIVASILGWQWLGQDLQNQHLLWCTYVAASALFNLAVLWASTTPGAWLGRAPTALLLAAGILLAVRLAQPENPWIANEIVVSAVATGTWLVLGVVVFRSRYGPLISSLQTHRDVRPARISIRQLLMLTAAVATLIACLGGLKFAGMESSYAFSIVALSFAFAVCALSAMWFVFAARTVIRPSIFLLAMCLVSFIPHIVIVALTSLTLSWTRLALYSLPVCSAALLITSLIAGKRSGLVAWVQRAPEHQINRPAGEHAGRNSPLSPG